MVKKFHIGYPNCGKDFAQSGDGTATDTFCPKCKAKLSSEVIGPQVCYSPLRARYLTSYRKGGCTGMT